MKIVQALPMPFGGVTVKEPLKNYLACPGGVEFGLGAPQKMLIYFV
jgi:hypothetical protein